MFGRRRHHNTLINKLDRKKLKVWEAVRNITRRQYFLIPMEPHEWASDFQELFFINEDRMLEGPYETRMLDPSYIAEWDNDFTKPEVKEFIHKMKHNKATDYDGIPTEFWMIFCTARYGIETLTNMLIKNWEIISTGRQNSFYIPRKTE
jgi:hypothetical protein